MTVPIVVMSNGVEILVTSYSDTSITFIVPSGAVSGPITIKVGSCTYNVDLSLNVIKPGAGEGVHSVEYKDYRWKQISSVKYNVDVISYTYWYERVGDSRIDVLRVKNLMQKSISNILIHVHRFNEVKQIKRIP